MKKPSEYFFFSLYDSKKFFGGNREGGDYEDAPMMNAVIDNAPIEDEHDGEIDQKLADVVTLVVGGYHTTAFALIWLLYYFTIHDDVQDKVFKEIREILGDKDVTPETMPKMKYLRQVIDETFRVSRLATIAARVSKDKELRIGGHLVPPGIPIIAALNVILHDDKVFPDPKKFDPDRFSGGKVPQLSNPVFGFGARRCPGYNWSHYEVVVAATTILKNFRVIPADEKDFSVECSYGLVTVPNKDIWVRFDPR